MSKSVTRRENAQWYPRITELGVTIHSEDRNGRAYPAYVTWQELDNAITEKWGAEGRDRFSKLFGCQTCVAEGPYPWDVEAVLERMTSGKLTGTQLLWD